MTQRIITDKIFGGLWHSAETFDFLASPSARSYNTVYAVRLRSPKSFAIAQDFFYAENNVQNCSAILNSGRRDITLDVLVAEQLRTSSGWLNFDRYKTKLRKEINMANQKEKDNAKENSRKNILKRLLQVTISVLVVAIILFTSAGRIDWIYAWTFIGASILIIIINAFLFPPELIAERGQI